MNERAADLLSFAGRIFGLARQSSFNSGVEGSSRSRNMRRRPALSATAAAFAVSACSGAAPESAEQTDFVPSVGGRDILATGFEPKGDSSSIEFGGRGDDPPSGMARIRSAALREASRRLGSQHGFARRAWEITQLLERRSAELSASYDFNRVATSTPGVPGFILPPVVARTFDAYALNRSSRSASHSDERFEVLKAASLSPVVPTWREYLVMRSKEPRELPRSLMPRGDLETSRFREWLGEGWDAGVEQAEAEFAKRVARLRRDYEGMLEHRRLVALGMMSPALIETEVLGVTGDTRSMSVGSHDLRIAGDAEFIIDEDLWSGANDEP